MILSRLAHQAFDEGLYLIGGRKIRIEVEALGQETFRFTERRYLKILGTPNDYEEVFVRSEIYVRPE